MCDAGWKASSESKGKGTDEGLSKATRKSAEECREVPLTEVYIQLMRLDFRVYLCLMLTMEFDEVTKGLFTLMELGTNRAFVIN